MKGLRRTKRWLAMLLAFTLAFSNVAYVDVPAVVFAEEENPETLEGTSETPVTEETPSEEKAPGEAPEQTPEEPAPAETPAEPSEEKPEGEEQPVETPAEAPTDEELTEEPEEEIEAPAENPEETPEEEKPAEEEKKDDEDAKPATYKVTFSLSGANGTVKVSTPDSEEMTEISADGFEETVEEASTVTFTVQADEGYSIDKVEVNGERKYADSQDGDVYTYTVSNIDSDKSVSISFAEAEKEDGEEEDENTEYTVEINHVLYTDNLGVFRTVEEVTLKDADFKDGSVDLMSHAYERKGMVCDTAELKLSKDDFSDGYADATIDYSIAPGWVAVRKDNTSAPSNGMRRARAIYVGTIEDVDIVPAGQITVSISFIDKDNNVLRDTVTESVEQENGSYNFSYAFDKILGYEDPKVDSTVSSAAQYTIEETAEGKYKITSTLPSDIQNDSVVIVFTAEAGTYVVVKRTPVEGRKNIDPENPDTYKEETSEPKTDKKIGELTDVEAETIEGFTPKAVEQQTVSADGDTCVIVEYVRNDCKVIYNTDGGSYIKPQKVLYEDEATVYTSTDAVPGTPEEKALICGKKEHVHTGTTGSCYQLNCNNRLHNVLGHNDSCYKLICTQEVHSHNTACYKITPAVPDKPATYDPIPTKPGYVFKGWYEDEACTIPAKKTIDSMTSDYTVYAKWEASEMTYTVVYFIENANDENYSYLDSMTKSAQVGTTVTASAGDVPSSLDKTNFTFERATTTTVAADGSSVVEAYYKRNVYTLTSNSSFRINGKNQKLTLTAKYGANITDLMNSTWNVPTGNKYAWSTSTNANTKVAVFDTMPSGNKTVYNFGYKTENKQTLNYWLENYNGSKSVNLDGKTYGLYKTVEVKFNYLYDSSDFYDFPGYTKGKALSNGDEYKFGNDTTDGLIVDFYYNAISYQLTLFGYEGKKISDNQVKLDADISSYLAEPEAPVKGAKFVGWYKDPGYTNLYDGDKKMPAGLILYAKWELPTYTVTFMDGSEKYDSQEVEYLKKATEISGERDGYEFAGWYADSACTEEFDFNEPITDSVTVYGKWLENTDTTYVIKHMVGDKVIKESTGAGKVGSTITARAIRLPGEYSTYITTTEGGVQSLVLQASGNEIIFEYVPFEGIKYTVQYVYDGTPIDKYTEEHEAKVELVKVWPNKETVKALNQEGYLVKEEFISKKLTSNSEANVLKFTLVANNFTISYAGIDDETQESVDISGLNNPTELTVVRDDISLINPDTSEGGSFADYEFLGWTTDASATTAGVNVDTSKPDTEVVIEKGSRGNMTFTAHFKRKDAVLKYDGNGATGGSTADTKGKRGKTVTVAANGFEKTGYKFDGWEDENGNSVSAGSEYLLTKNEQTLRAKWEKDETQRKELSYTIEYYKDNDLEETIKDQKLNVWAGATSGEVEASLVAPVNKYPNYEFEKTTPEISNGKITISNGTVIKVYYKSAQKTIVPVETEGANLTGSNLSWVYDGIEHTGNAKIVDKDGKTLEGYTLSYENNSITDVGTKTVKVTATKEGCADITGEFTIEVTPKPVTIAVEDSGKQYGEDDPAFKGDVNGLVKAGDLGDIRYRRTNDAEEVGAYPGVLTADYTENSNYSVTVQNGKFTITKADSPEEIVTKKDGDKVEGSDLSWVYDGQKHAGEAAVEGPNAADYRVEYSIGGESWSPEAPGVTNVSEGQVTVSVRAESDKYKTLTGEFTIQITAKPVTIKVKDASKQYGTDDPAFEGTVDGLVAEGDLGEVSYSRTNKEEEAVGTYPDVLTAGYTKNGNYSVTVQNGKFTITKADSPEEIVTKKDGDKVEGSDLSWVYDGQKHAGEAAVEGPNAADYRVEYSIGGESWSPEAPGVTNVSEGQVTVSVRAESDKYKTLTGEFTIQITAKPVTIKVKDASKQYGTDDPAFEGTVDGLVAEGDLGEVSYSRTNKEEEAVGTYPDVLTAGYTKNGNYSVTVQNGKFTITKADSPEEIVTKKDGDKVEGSDLSWVYDGQKHAGEAAVEGPNAADYRVEYSIGGESWSPEAPGVTNVSEGQVTVSVRAESDKYKTLTGEFTIQITAKPVTIKVKDASKQYGTDDPAFEGTVDGLVAEGDLGEVSYSRTNKEEEAVGTYPDVLTAGYTKNGNYSVTVQNGKFTITKADSPEEIVTKKDGDKVEGSDLSWVYDGQKHAGEAAVEGPNAADYRVEYSIGGESWSPEAPGVTNVSEGQVTVSVRAESDKYKTLTGEFTIQITAKPVTIKVKDASKQYGTDDPAFEGTVDGLVAEGDLGEVSYSRTNKEEEAVGTYPDVLTAGYTKNGNYSVTVQNGKFTITKADSPEEIVTKKDGDKVEGSDLSWVYDGQKHAGEAAVEGPNAADYRVEYSIGGESWSPEAPGVTNVSEGQVTVSVRAESDKYKTLTGEFTIQITAKPVTIKVKDASKQYGTDDPAFEGTVDGLVAEGDLGEVSYSRTNKEEEAVGTYPDVLTAGYTKNGNYSVTVQNGKFTITKADSPEEIVTKKDGDKVEGSDLSWVYDGQKHAGEAAVEGPNAADYRVEYSIGGESWSPEAPGVTNVSEGQVTVSVRAESDKYKTLTGEFTIQITAKPVTIKVKDASKQYGTDDPAFEGTVDGLVAEGDLGEVSYSRTNKEEEAVGTYPDVLTAGYTKNGNYSVTVQNGKFTITKADSPEEIVTKKDGDKVEGSDLSWVYDGQKHAGEAAVEGPNAADYRVEYSIGGESWSPEAPGVTNVSEGQVTVSVRAESDKYKTLTGEFTIQITAKPVTIAVKDSAKLLGEADPAFTGEVTGLVKAGDLGDISYSRTNAGVEAIGEYADVLTAGYTENSNYSVTVVNGKFSITGLSYIVRYVDMNGNPVAPERKVSNQSLNKEVTENAINVSGYALDDSASTKKLVIVADEKQNIITFVYSADTMSDPDEDKDDDPDNGDGIPDRFQVEVRFEVVNGKWTESGESEGITRVVTLKKDGKPSEDGTATLNPDQIPGSERKSSKYQKTGKWDSDPSTAVITGAMTFTITYSPVPNVPTTDPTPDPTPTPDPGPGPDPDPTPDPTPAPTPDPAPVTPPAPAVVPTPAPAGPAAPAGAAAPAAPVVAVQDDEVPLANIDLGEEDGEEPVGVEELVGIEEEEVPLANEDIHDCCIFHFLEMLLAIIILAWYTHNSKKRQKRIFELREQLAVEQVNRGITPQNYSAR